MFFVLQAVANIFEWSKLQATVQRSFAFQEFVQPRAGNSTAWLIVAVSAQWLTIICSKYQEASQLHLLARAVLEVAPVQATAPSKRRLTAFARKHSVLATAAASSQQSPKPAAPATAALVSNQDVQAVVEGTLGVKATPTQPLMEAGMDSLGDYIIQVQCKVTETAHPSKGGVNAVAHGGRHGLIR